MRTITENKAMSMAPTGGPKCPQCGRKGGACRSVPLGYWCQTDGLIEDTSRWIYPEPDPIHDAIGKDVGVMAARLEESMAQAEFDKCHEVWLSALSALSAARITRVGVYTSEGEFRPPSRRDAKREERLLDAEAEAKREREKAGELLVEASVRHQRAVTAARRALGPA